MKNLGTISQTKKFHEKQDGLKLKNRGENMARKDDMVVRGVLLMCLFVSILFNFTLILEIAEQEEKNRILLDYNQELANTNIELSEKYNYEKLQAEYYYSQLHN